MKSFLVFSLLALWPSLILMAQIDPWDGRYDVDSCDLETKCSFLHLTDTSATALWQIGEPQKPFFDTAYSPVNALVTDTINPYPVGQQASFELRIPMGINIILGFWHKYQTDSLQDGGYIEVSYEKGENWVSIYDDTWYTEFNSVNLYSPNDTLANGEPGFTGTSPGWVHTEIQWIWCLPVECYNDTVYFRFNFYSDSTDNQKAGWMIDDFDIDEVIIPGSVFGNRDPESLKLWPNPAQGEIRLQIPETILGPYEIEIFELSGRMVEKFTGLSGKENDLDIAHLRPGHYQVMLWQEGQPLGRSRLIVE